MKTVTVATDCIQALENWEHSVKENKHDYDQTLIIFRPLVWKQTSNKYNTQA